MEIINLLFQSGEIIKKRVKEIEQRNINSLIETEQEIRDLVNKATKGKSKKRKTIYVHDTSKTHFEHAFPVDYRISK